MSAQGRKNSGGTQTQNHPLRTKRRTRVAEGTWCAVPVGDLGWALGLVARSSRRGGILILYVFDVVAADPSALTEVRRGATDALAILRCGDLGFHENRWQRFGVDASWRREAYPTPIFVRPDILLPGRTWRVQYSDDDPGVLQRQELRVGQIDGPRDSLRGSGAAEHEAEAEIRRAREQEKQP